ncbi:HAD-like domain-containing protein, partial [Blyttiomyces helicus]
VVDERLAKGQDELREATFDQLEDFAREGLRTLCVARRQISEAEYKEWNEQYHAASTAMRDREEALDAVAEIIERDLELVGATAVEDKLQDAVPATISLLREAGIKIWVLTGDKSKPRSTLASRQTSFTATCRLSLSAVPQTRPGNVGKDRPMLKAQVVRLVKKAKLAICLSVGDGANDVAMIQEAHVGVGIAGKEGVQAAMAADYEAHVGVGIAGKEGVQAVMAAD